MPKYDKLPMAGVKVVDDSAHAPSNLDSRRAPDKRIVVFVDGRPVCQLPATGVKYDLEVRGIGVAWVGLHLDGVRMAAGDLSLEDALADEPGVHDAPTAVLPADVEHVTYCIACRAVKDPEHFAVGAEGEKHLFRIQAVT